MNTDATAGRSSLDVRVDSRHWVVPTGGSLTIGRERDADGRIDDTHISPRHAAIEWTPAGWLLTDHSHNGVFING
jgi:pSer/pThr/pTyr-binding forkhead associated (FHA) protein